MRLAVMQPYAFPYLGYFQLMNAVDRFVVLDDVTYIKAGWLNRNCLMGPHGPLRFTLPIEGASSHRRIDDLQLVAGALWRDKLLRTVEQCYSRSPGFAHTWPLVEAALRFPERRLTDWLRHSLKLVCQALGVKTPVVSAAAAHPAGSLSGQCRVIDICRREGATDYINAEGGRMLYAPEDFAQQALRLHFLTHHPRAYPQRGAEFIARLSIIDVMMSNLPSALPTFLSDCSITLADRRPPSSH